MVACLPLCCSLWAAVPVVEQMMMIRIPFLTTIDDTALYHPANVAWTQLHQLRSRGSAREEAPRLGKIESNG